MVCAHQTVIPRSWGEPLDNWLVIRILVYYIYIQRLFNNNTLDLYDCLTQFMQALQIEENICIKNKNEENFFKFNFIYDNL